VTQDFKQDLEERIRIFCLVNDTRYGLPDDMIMVFNCM